MEELAQGGVLGFKAFSCPSGLDEFPACDGYTLLKAMEKAKKLNLPILLHAEDFSLTQGLQRELQEKGRKDPRAFLESRPLLAELLAVEDACKMALETGAHLHLCHLSSAKSLEICKKYKALGAVISVESIGQYFLWNEEKVLEGGALYKCTPPLRPEEERKALFEAILRGDVDMVASDHSPAPVEMKRSSDFFALWGGISSLQHWLCWTASHLLEEGLSLESFSQLVGKGPLEIFGLQKKFGLELGKEANFTLLRRKKRTIQKEELLYQVPESALVGEKLFYDVEASFLRGEAVYYQGKFSQPKGRFVHAGPID